MKLNHECIREVLIFIESQDALKLNEDGDLCWCHITLEHICEALPKYAKGDVFYSLYNLDQAGILDCSIRYANNVVYHCLVNHITYNGHEFLERIRDEKRWGTVKAVLASIRDYSLSAISAVAEGATNAAISSFAATHPENLLYGKWG